MERAGYQFISHRNGFHTPTVIPAKAGIHLPEGIGLYYQRVLSMPIRTGMQPASFDYQPITFVASLSNHERAALRQAPFDKLRANDISGIGK